MDGLSRIPGTGRLGTAWERTADASLRQHPAVPVILICLIAFGVYCLGIGDEALWLDESESLFWASLPLSDLSMATGHSNHAPTYFAVLHGWRVLGGESEAWLRLLSANFTVGTIPLVYLLGRVVSSHTVGLTAAVVYASSPFIFQFAQEARPYAMLSFFTAVALLCVAVGVREYLAGRQPAVLGLGWRRGQLKDDAWWCVLIGATLVVITTHHTAVLFPFILGGACFFILLSRPHRRVHLLNMAMAAAVVGVVYTVFFLPTFLTSLDDFKQPAVGLWSTLRQMNTVYGNRFVTDAFFILAPAGIAAVWCWCREKRWPWLLLFLSAWLGMLVLVLAIGEWRGSVLKYRTFIWTFVPFAVLVGEGIWRLRPPPAAPPPAGMETRHLRLLPVLLLTALLAVNAAGIGYAYAGTKEPWRETASVISERYQNGDAVVFCPHYTRKAFIHHWNHGTGDLWGHQRNDEGEDTVRPMPSPREDLGYRLAERTEMTEFESMDALDRYDRVWWVHTNHGSCPRGLGDAVYARDVDHKTRVTLHTTQGQ